MSTDNSKIQIASILYFMQAKYFCKAAVNQKIFKSNVLNKFREMVTNTCNTGDRSSCEAQDPFLMKIYTFQFNGFKFGFGCSVFQK